MTLRLSGGRKLLSPQGNTARPTTARVRLAVMNLFAADLAGCRWLDLCCGSGVMGCEALQRGAAAVVAVDQDRRMAATALANLTAVQTGTAATSTVRVVCRPLPAWLLEMTPARRPAEVGHRDFDLIYVDPPYRSGLQETICAAIDQGDWLAPAGRLILECGSELSAQAPTGWMLEDRRRYGSTSLMLLSRGHCPGGTGSMPPRTGPRS
ncbi:16S rRNA (guanine(966)-N(2))-methyltransferase RsmD [Synechococcus sp. CS-1327]|nr:16S rRNA (guanine(966)-N(2))-methyltransferase RsmD [Synechococcus sp. CS-1326]MCT0232476.1 16S rRNA (guanine(966)-N(2))-methyltransferase RsmD [Synechococcus sp. CS-1327]